MSLEAPSHPHPKDVRGPLGEAAMGIEEIPRVPPHPWDELETMTHTFLKCAYRVNIVHEEYTNPQIRKLEDSLGLVNNEI